MCTSVSNLCVQHMVVYVDSFLCWLILTISEMAVAFLDLKIFLTIVALILVPITVWQRLLESPLVAWQPQNDSNPAKLL